MDEDQDSCLDFEVLEFLNTTSDVRLGSPSRAGSSRPPSLGLPCNSGSKLKGKSRAKLKSSILALHLGTPVQSVHQAAALRKAQSCWSPANISSHHLCAKSKPATPAGSIRPLFHVPLEPSAPAHTITLSSKASKPSSASRHGPLSPPVIRKSFLSESGSDDDVIIDAPSHKYRFKAAELDVGPRSDQVVCRGLGTPGHSSASVCTTSIAGGSDGGAPSDPSLGASRTREAQLVSLVQHLSQQLTSSRQAEALAKQRAAELLSVVKGASRQRSDMRQELDKARKDASTSGVDLVVMRRRLEALQRFLHQEKEARQEADRKLAVAESAKQTLTAQVQIGKQQLDLLTASVEESGVMQSRQAVQSLKDELSQARTLLAASQDEVAALQVQNHALQQQVAGLQSALEQLYVAKIGKEQLQLLQQQLAEEQAHLIKAHTLGQAGCQGHGSKGRPAAAPGGEPHQQAAHPPGTAAAAAAPGVHTGAQQQQVAAQDPIMCPAQSSSSPPPPITLAGVHIPTQVKQQHAMPASPMLQLPHHHHRPADHDESRGSSQQAASSAHHISAAQPELREELGEGCIAQVEEQASGAHVSFVRIANVPLLAVPSGDPVVALPAGQQHNRLQSGRRPSPAHHRTAARPGAGVRCQRTALQYQTRGEVLTPEGESWDHLHQVAVSNEVGNGDDEQDCCDAADTAQARLLLHSPHHAIGNPLPPVQCTSTHAARQPVIDLNQLADQSDSCSDGSSSGHDDVDARSTRHSLHSTPQRSSRAASQLRGSVDHNPGAKVSITPRVSRCNSCSSLSSAVMRTRSALMRHKMCARGSSPAKTLQVPSHQRTVSAGPAVDDASSTAVAAGRGKRASILARLSVVGDHRSGSSIDDDGNDADMTL